MTETNNIFRSNFAVLTMSDKGSRGERRDTSGPWIKETLQERGYIFEDYRIIADEKKLIIASLRELVEENIALIVTTGGTGVSPTDQTPEATAEVLDKEIPGIAEAMRAISFTKTNRAMLSRGKVGICNETLIINLPGSLKAVQENLAVVLDVLPHTLEKIQGGKSDCGVEDSSL